MTTAVGSLKGRGHLGPVTASDVGAVPGELVQLLVGQPPVFAWMGTRETGTSVSSTLPLSPRQVRKSHLLLTMLFLSLELRPGPGSGQVGGSGVLRARGVRQFTKKVYPCNARGICCRRGAASTRRVLAPGACNVHTAFTFTRLCLEADTGFQTPAKSDHVHVVTSLPPTTGSGCQQERPERPTRVHYLTILFHFSSFKNFTSKWESEGEKLPSI